MPKYKRVLLKLSGETLMGQEPFGISQTAASRLADNIKRLYIAGIEIGLVCGGGNLFRGVQQGSELNIERTPADQAGMVATLMNGIILKAALEKIGCAVSLLSALDCPKVAESYQWDKAMHYLAKGKIVIFVGGTGNPYFTTDTASALRACEIKADIWLKATTHVDGVYDKDPRKYRDAHRYDHLSYTQALEKQVGIIDLSAITLCMSEKIDIRVFNYYNHSLIDAVSNNSVGTIITD